jgi:hypothetical protein
MQRCNSTQHRSAVYGYREIKIGFMINPEKVLSEFKMPGTAHGQKLGETLDQTKDYGFKEIHVQ